MVDANFDTGLNCHSDTVTNHSIGSNKGGGRQIDYSVDQSKHFIVYSQTDTSSANNSELWLAWGNEDSWSSVQLCDWDNGSGSGLLQNGYDIGTYDCYYHFCALAIDNTHDTLHVVWISQSRNSPFLLTVFHAKCTDLSAPGTVGNWQTYGGSYKFQKVDNSTSSVGINCLDIDIMEHTTYGTVFVVYSITGDGIYINSASDSTSTFTTSAETEIQDTSSTNYTYPTITCVDEGGTPRNCIYVAYVKYAAANYDAYVKRCETATSNWGTSSNWKGPVTGTTTPDSIFNYSSATDILAPSITHWYSGDTNKEQVFVGGMHCNSGVSIRAWDNWYDEVDYTGSGPGWVGPTWTSENVSYHGVGKSAVQVTALNGNFRYIVCEETGTGSYADSKKYGDTNSGSSSFTHASLVYTPDPSNYGPSDPAPGHFAAERKAYDLTNGYSALFAIPLDSVTSGTDIYVIYPSKNATLEQACALGATMDGGVTLVKSLSQAASLNASMDGALGMSLGISVDMYCGANLSMYTTESLGCALGVSLSGVGSPSDPFQESGEEGTDPFDWTPGASNEALFFVGNDNIGVSNLTYINVSRWVAPGWNINRTEEGDISLHFSLANPEGKFTYSASVDYVELKRDTPVIVAWGGNIYFHGIVDKPPAEDTPDGSTVSVSCLSRQALMRYEDVTKRYLMAEWSNVEDVIYDIIYESTSLNSYFGIVYTKPDPKDRNPLMRDFIFNNRDAHTCIKELTDFHNLLFYMDVDSSGLDVITLSRLLTANREAKISTTLSEENCLNFTKDRGSEVFYNRIKLIARSDDGDVLVAEQQDVKSIRDEGLHVRPVEDVGTVQSQAELQAQAEYLLAKHGTSNYTTTISLDPTKFTELQLWDLRPLDIVKVTHERLELGTDEKYVVQSVELGGETDQLTSVSVVLNHRWRNASIMRFEEQPSVYDKDQVVEDEDLVHSRIMSASVDVRGYYDIYVNTTHNYYPSDQLTTGGILGLTEHGKQLIKTNWLRDPSYGTGGSPSNPYTMRISSIWPLDVNGWAIPMTMWHLDTNGFHNTYEIGSGPPAYNGIYFSQDIVADHDFDVYGLLVCSRYGGRVVKTSSYGTIYGWYLDDVKYLRIGMELHIYSDNPQTPGTATQFSGRILSIDYELGYVTAGGTKPVPAQLDPSATFWYCDCFPVAYVDYPTEVSFTATDTGSLDFRMFFYSDLTQYLEKNLSVVTLNGLNHISKRLSYDIFNEARDDASTYNFKPPVNLAIGLNDPGKRYEVLQAHTNLVKEVARSTDVTSGGDFISSVSDSAKVTAKFRSNVIPPRTASGTLSDDAVSGSKEIYLDNIDGVLPGDAIFFGVSGTGAWEYSVTKLGANYIEQVGEYYDSPYTGYQIRLRHGISENKNTGTAWTTGKIVDMAAETIEEFGLFDEPVIEIEEESFYLGKRTGNATYPEDLNLYSGAEAMGYGDYQYDHLQSEDSLAKTTDTPPSFFSEEASEDTDYLISVKGIGYSTVPLIGMMQGGIPEEITFDSDDFYGRSAPITTLWRAFKTIANPTSCMTISPISRVSYLEQINKSSTLYKGYNASKWRLFKRWLSDETRDEANFWYKDKFVIYAPEFAAQLFSFAVDDSIKRQDLKEINLVWRGSAKSWDGSDYRDGTVFYIWHWGDHQLLYKPSDSGSGYVATGRVGDVKTYFEHWEAIEMVDGSGAEHDNIVPDGVDLNPMYSLRSRLNGGSSNTEGINKVGYCISEDNKIWILAISRYTADDEDKKISRILTDFIGLSVGTSNVLESEEKSFKKGIDYFHTSDWNFISWPSLDYTYTGGSPNPYESRYNLQQVATMTVEQGMGAAQIFTSGSSWFTPGNTILLESEDGATHEIVQISSNNNDIYHPILTAPLVNDWSVDAKIFAHIGNVSEFPVQVLGKKITPDFPSRGYVRTPLGTYSGYSTHVASPGVDKPSTQTAVGSTAGFANGDIVMFWRTPVLDTENAYGYEWRTLSSNPPSSTVLAHDQIIREKIDNDSHSYDDGTDPNWKTTIGIVDFEVPGIETGLTLGWLTSGGVWSDGDASGTKWRERNPTWGLSQYPNIEATVGSLSTSAVPDYTGWDQYGGPGVKIEEYDEANGRIKITKAYDIPLTEMTDGNTDSESEKRDNVYHSVNLKCMDYFWLTATHWSTFFMPDDDGVAVEANEFCRNWDAYGNRSDTLSYYSLSLKVPRNSAITLRSDISLGGTDIYYQFSLAETSSISGFEGNDWKLVPKYRCLESAGKTCVKDSECDTTPKTWYLDAPYFDTDYHDEKTGKVVFIIDVIDKNLCEFSHAMPTVSAGSSTFTLSGSGTDIRIHDVMLIIKSGGTGYEMVQVTDKSGDLITVAPHLLNSYNAADTIYWHPYDFVVSIYYHGETRLVIDAVQVYGPAESGETIGVSSNVYRPAKYRATYAKKTGNLLVYSILKDHSVFRPVKSDMADTLQFIQEVKFNYQEKDTV